MAGETVELASQDGFRFKAYKVQPQGRAKGAVVIGPEIFGVNSHIRSVAHGYANDGYLVIAPQLFDRERRDYEAGYSPDDIEAGRAIIGTLNWTNTIKDTAAAIEHARPAGKVALVGYCWGGTIAWLAAARLSGVACTVAYYGGGIPDFVGEPPKVPILLHFGEKDNRPAPQDAREVATRYPDALQFSYPAGHGFNCDQRGSYDEPSARLARTRTVEFLAKHL